MSEKVPGPRATPEPDKGASALVRMPNGEFVSIEDLLSRETVNEPIEFPLSSLKPEDLVTATWETGDYKPESFSFRLKEGEWTGLLMGGGSPTKSWDVEIENGVPGASGPVPARFIGSGFGGSMLSPGTLMTGRTLVFGLGDRHEWQTPFVQKLKVLRKEGDAYTVLNEAELLEQEEGIEAMHHARLEQFKHLMEHFGFSSVDFRDFSKSTKSYMRAQDGRFVAYFNASMAQGNTLGLFDTEKQRWVTYRYYNWKKEDTLQIAYADVDPELFKKESGYGENPYVSLGSDAVHRTGGWLATHTTSPTAGLDALAYHVSDADARNILHIPSWGDMQPSVTIELIGDQEPHIPNDYPLCLVTEKDPELMPNIRAALSAERVNDGRIMLRIGSETRKILSPEQVFEGLHIPPPST